EDDAGHAVPDVDVTPPSLPESQGSPGLTIGGADDGRSPWDLLPYLPELGSDWGTRAERALPVESSGAAPNDAVSRDSLLPPLPRAGRGSGATLVSLLALILLLQLLLRARRTLAWRGFLPNVLR